MSSASLTAETEKRIALLFPSDQYEQVLQPIVLAYASAYTS